MVRANEGPRSDPKRAFPAFFPSTIRLLVIMLISSMSYAATYHVRADGSAGKGAATSCGSEGTAMNIFTFKNQYYSPGDRIVFCHEGGPYREAVLVPADGSPESPIIYDGRGTAVFSGSDVVTGWHHIGGSIYSAHFHTNPHQVFIDSVFGNRKTGVGQLTSHRDWYFDGTSLYLYSSQGNPDSVFSNPGVEASARQWALIFSGRNHIIIEGIIAKHTNLNGIDAWNPGSYVKVRNCVAEWNWKNGIAMNGTSIYSDMVVEDCIARHNGNGGITILGPGRNSFIRRNSCYENGKEQSIPIQFEWEHDWTYGIKLFDGSGLQEGIIVEANKSYNNGRFMWDDYQGRGVGIWVDAVPGTPNNPTIVRHNSVFNNAGNGIFIEISSNSITTGNVVFNNATNSGGHNEYAPGNIVIDSRNNFHSSNNLVYNNTSYGGRKGIKVVTYEQWNCRVDNNIIRNNIAVGASEHNLYAVWGGDNDGIWGSGNIYENNNFGRESSDFINWNWIDYDSYTAWETAYGNNTYSVSGDPEFAGITPNTLTLKPSSPCRDSGMILGSVSAVALSPESSWPNSVVIEDQDSHGTGWEVGAYVYSTAGLIPTIFVDDLESGNLDGWTIVD